MFYFSNFHFLFKFELNILGVASTNFNYQLWAKDLEQEVFLEYITSPYIIIHDPNGNLNEDLFSSIFSERFEVDDCFCLEKKYQNFLEVTFKA